MPKHAGSLLIHAASGRDLSGVPGCVSNVPHYTPLTSKPHRKSSDLILHCPPDKLKLSFDKPFLLLQRGSKYNKITTSWFWVFTFAQPPVGHCFRMCDFCSPTGNAYMPVTGDSYHQNRSINSPPELNTLQSLLQYCLHLFE